MSRVLQNIPLPETHLPLPRGLWLRGGGARVVGGALRLTPGARVDLGGYCGVMNATQWRARAGIGDLHLTLTGQGRVGFEILRDGRVLHRGKARLSATPRPFACLRGGQVKGVLSLRLWALEGQAWLHRAQWRTTTPPRRRPRIALVIPTFRREAQVQASISRLRDLIADRGLGRDIAAHLFVIDHGQSLPPPADCASVSLFSARNLGGSGGFARGLVLARAHGFSHAIFMDDDATLPDEALMRMAGFLSYARNESTAIAAAMLTPRNGRLWEDGALFDRVCRPRLHGLDLTDPRAVMRLEAARGALLPANAYGGFWGFAFPVANVRHLPFPFFLRGDDSGFCLANRFDLTTLAGVFAVQEGFDTRQTPALFYRDLRYHLHHHLVHPILEIGARRSAAVALRLLWRAFRRRNRAEIWAGVVAWAGLLRGPSEFDAIPPPEDLARRLGQRPPPLALSAVAAGILSMLWLIAYPKLKARFRQAYPRQTSQAFWQAQFQQQEVA